MSTTRRIVSDTGPLISLEKLAGGFTFIRMLYVEILVPPAVIRELAYGRFESTDAYLAHYAIQDLLSVTDLSPMKVTRARTRLDEGEVEAIQLAMEEKLPLLIEEQAGRKIARELGLHVSGIAGQLRKGFQRGVLSEEEATGKLDELFCAGRINSKVHNAVCQAITGEP